MTIDDEGLLSRDLGRRSVLRSSLRSASGGTTCQSKDRPRNKLNKSRFHHCPPGLMTRFHIIADAYVPSMYTGC